MISRENTDEDEKLLNLLRHEYWSNKTTLRDNLGAIFVFAPPVIIMLALFSACIYARLWPLFFALLFLYLLTWWPFRVYLCKIHNKDIKRFSNAASALGLEYEEAEKFYNDVDWDEVQVDKEKFMSERNNAKNN